MTKHNVLDRLPVLIMFSTLQALNATKERAWFYADSASEPVRSVAADGHKLWPDWLRKIDTLLEDEAVIEVVAKGLEARWPQSRRRGRPGTPAEIVIRMLILKHLFDWSYDDLEREVRANLVYRAFTRIDADEYGCEDHPEDRACTGPSGHRAAA